MIQRATQATYSELNALLRTSILGMEQPQRRVDLPTICDELGLPPGDDDVPTKAKYIESRLEPLNPFFFGHRPTSQALGAFP